MQIGADLLHIRQLLQIWSIITNWCTTALIKLVAPTSEHSFILARNFSLVKTTLDLVKLQVLTEFLFSQVMGF